MIHFLQILASASIGFVGGFALLCCLFGVSESLDTFFERRVIVDCEKQPYLHRWYIFRTKHCSLFVHKFVRSDEDRALHDHPWAFLVIPIWRGYWEHSINPNFEALIPKAKLLAEGYGMATTHIRRVWPIIDTRFRPATYRHRVQLLRKSKLASVIDGQKWYESNPAPAWSLFFHFTKKRDWGFWPKEGFIVWNKWWQDKCGGDE